MRLKSITVRNYRVHRELTVPLDPALNVIGGPNEAGKSTLLEAARYALFLRAKGGGETQKSMVSLTHQGHPEVEVAFEIAGQNYTISKRFSGANGTAVLTQAGGGTWQGEEAETKLGSLLGVEIFHGRNASEKVEQQWAHLLVSQGRSGSAPAEYANGQRDQLLARLQSLGGAAVLQSETDASVAGRFRDLVQEWFTVRNEPRVSSDWGRAEIEVKQAVDAVAVATSELNRLEEAVRQHQQAQERLALAEPEKERIRRDLATVTQQLAQATELRRTITTQQGEVQRVVESHQTLEKSETEIAQLRAQAAQLREALSPREQALQAQKLRIEETRGQELMLAGERQKLEAELRDARAWVEAARHQVEWLERSQTLEQLRRRVEQVKEVAAKQKEEEQALARLPQMDAARLRMLRSLETEAAQAEAALAAMATGVELLTSDQEVLLDGKVITPGETRVISSPTSLALGQKVELRIHPGGGSSLTQAQQRAEKAHTALQSLLDESGVGSVQAAVEVSSERQVKEGSIEGLKRQLEALGAGKVGRELAAAEQDVARAQGDLERRRAACHGMELTTDLSVARVQAANGIERLSELENKEITRARLLETVTRTVREAATQLERLQQAYQAEKDQLTSREAQLSQMMKMLGTDGEREAKLQESLDLRLKAEEKLAHTQRELTLLQPELLEGDQQRLTRSMERQTEMINQATTEREASLLVLRSEGSMDPHATLAAAEAQLAESRRLLEQAQRRGLAIRRLHELFLEEQRLLTDQFTLPLAEKVSGYLQCLFGPETRVQVRLDADSRFEKLEIVRPDRQAGALEFDVLSGGAREQVAAALRLAMAEVLSTGQPDKCLPLVFDDAFAYSDPERVRLLPRMLDLAARRGLQVIILTCHPADYASLGAQEFRLKVPVSAPAVPAAPPSFSS